jgi:hypothetical protein
MTIADLTRSLQEFAVERDWEQFHTPKNLAVQTSGAAGAAIVGATAYVQQIGQKDWAAWWAAQTSVSPRVGVQHVRTVKVSTDQAASCDSSCDNSWPTRRIHSHSRSVKGRGEDRSERQSRWSAAV